jgi:hypothetical protein
MADHFKAVHDDSARDHTVPPTTYTSDGEAVLRELYFVPHAHLQKKPLETKRGSRTGSAGGGSLWDLDFDNPDWMQRNGLDLMAAPGREQLSVAKHKEVEEHFEHQEEVRRTIHAPLRALALLPPLRFDDDGKVLPANEQPGWTEGDDAEGRKEGGGEDGDGEEGEDAFDADGLDNDDDDDDDGDDDGANGVALSIMGGSSSRPGGVGKELGDPLREVKPGGKRRRRRKKTGNTGRGNKVAPSGMKRRPRGSVSMARQVEEGEHGDSLWVAQIDEETGVPVYVNTMTDQRTLHCVEKGR